VWFKHRAWIPVAGLLCLANLAAVWFAAQPAEPWHATTHAVLAVLFGLGAQHLWLRKKPTVDSDLLERLKELESRRGNLEPQQMAQALDAIALEVERIGEGQRYLTKVIAEREGRAAKGTNASAPAQRRGE
jgi:hypothetical protein